MPALKEWARETIPPIAVFVAADVLITLAFLTLSSSSAKIGTLRPEATIPLKLLELALGGFLVGAVACVARRKFDASLLTFGVAFIALLDVDHLPVVFGLSQPIRPAHSIFFVVAMVLALIVIFRTRQEVGIIFLASFLMHMALDTGVFAIFAPFSFQYYSLGQWTIVLAISSLLVALAAGLKKRTNDARLAKISLKTEVIA